MFISKLLWEILYKEVVASPKRTDALKDFVALTGPKTHLYPLTFCRGSGTIAVYYWKLNGAKFAVSHKWKI